MSDHRPGPITVTFFGVLLLMGLVGVVADVLGFGSYLIAIVGGGAIVTAIEVVSERRSRR